MRLILSISIIFIFFGCAIVTKNQTLQKKETITKKENFPKSNTIKDNSKLKAILELDTKGHTSMIKDIITTKDGDIISASDDKSIRVWDSKSGKEKQKILGKIGDGAEGMIYAIALSSDEKYLAVGGYLTGAKKSGERYGIRIYNYQSGKLLKVLKSHTNVVNDLAFSADGKYLVSGSFNNSVKVWDMESFTLKETISFHTDSVYAVEIIKKGDDYYIYSAGDDNKIALHSLKRGYLNSYESNYKFYSLAKGGEYIASSGFGREILIFDHNLKLIKRVESETNPLGLAFDESGEYLVAGTSAYPLNVNLYTTDNFQKITSFKKHKNTTLAVAFLGEYIVSGGGDNFEIYIWDKSGKVINKIEGVGNRIWSVGIDGDRVAWGNISNYLNHNNRGKLQKFINLKNFKIESISNENSFNRISTINGDYSLSHRKGGNYGYSDAVLDIKRDSKTITSITKDATNGLAHRCYGWYGDYIISGGSNGDLKIYDKSGKEVASLMGHTGEIWSIAIDGDTLVSGGDDQTIRLWDLRDLKTSQKIYPYLNLFISKDGEWVAWTRENFFTASEKGSELIGFHINQGVDKEALFLPIDKFEVFHRPDLIQMAINGESLASYAKGIDIETILKGGLPPEVKILHYSQKEGSVDLRVQVCERGGGYNNLTLSINSTPIELTKDRGLFGEVKEIEESECVLLNKKITLIEGVNSISLKATNRDGKIESNIDKITLYYTPRKIVQPNLHIFAMGIDKYRDGDLWLNYSVADAKAILSEIPNNAKKLFKEIHTYELFDKDVTKNNFIAKMGELSKKIKAEDVFVFFMAGHGVTDSKTAKYFYLPYDFRYKGDESIEKYAISDDDLKEGLAKIKALKSLVMLDTCNSGSFADAISRNAILQKTVIRKLVRATGRATIMASSKDQVALEGYNGHGVFTFAILKAIGGDGYGSDDKMTIKELSAYVEDKVPEFTFKKWQYEQIPQANISGNDFPLTIK